MNCNSKLVSRISINCYYCLAMLIITFTAGCNKDHDPVITPDDEGPLKVTALTPLPDEIPYQKLGHGKICFQRFYNKSSESEFYVIDVDKGKSSGFKLGSEMKQPNISPGGNKIVCSLLNASDVNPNWNIYVMNIDGTECFPAYESDQRADYPTWNNNGSKIIFYTNDGILRMQSPVENATDREELIKFHYSDDPTWEIHPSGGFSASPSGNLVAVSTSQSLDGLIGIQPYIGKTGVNVLVKPSDLSDGILSFWIESPVYSPDGSKIAFLALYKNLTEEWIGYSITIMNADGTNILQAGGSTGPKLKINLPRSGSLCWSPDGKRILFTMADSETSSHLYVLTVNPELNEGGYAEVTNMPNAYDSEVSWSN